MTVFTPPPPSTTGPIRARFLGILDFLLRWKVQVYSVGVTPMSVTVLLDDRGGPAAATAVINAHRALESDGPEPPQITLRPYRGLGDEPGAIITVSGVLPGIGDISVSTQLDPEIAELVMQAADHEDLPPDTDTVVDEPSVRVAAGLSSLAADAQKPEPAPDTEGAEQ